MRKTCRDIFHSSRLLERIVPDLQRVVGLAPQRARLFVHRGVEGTGDDEEGLGEAPGALWNEDGSRTDGARNFAPAKASRNSGPSIAKTGAKDENRGDAYEADLEWPLAAGGGDDEAPF